MPLQAGDNDISIFITSGGPPIVFRLLPSYPNPFNSVANIPFYSEGGQLAKIVIMDILGRELLSFDKQNTSRGYNEVKWDGLDSYGIRAASGVYIYSVQTESSFESDRMVYLK